MRKYLIPHNNRALHVDRTSSIPTVQHYCRQGSVVPVGQKECITSCYNYNTVHCMFGDTAFLLIPSFVLR